MQYQHDIPRNIKSTVQARCSILISANNRQNQRHFYFLQLPATNVKRNEQAYEIEHSDSRFDSLTESIRFGFPKKAERPIRLHWLLASVCQTTDRRITAADTTVTITTHERVSIITHHCRHSSVTAQSCRLAVAFWHHFLWLIYCFCKFSLATTDGIFFLRYLLATFGVVVGRPGSQASLPPPGLRPCVGESNQFSGVNRNYFWRSDITHINDNIRPQATVADFWLRP